MSDQPELPGMPEESPLAIFSKSFVDQKQKIAEAKLKLDVIEEEMLKRMEEDGVPHFKVTVGGENYEFEIAETITHVRCAKITKTIKPNQPVDAEKPEPAAV